MYAPVTRLFLVAVFTIILNVLPPATDGTNRKGRSLDAIRFGLAVLLLLAASIALQIFRTRRAPLGRVLHILANIRHAEKICRQVSDSRKVRKFRVNGWEKNKEKVRFLPEELRTELDRLFGTLADSNIKIDTAAKFKSDAYLVTIDVNKLEEPLAAGRQKLQRWLEANMHNPEYLPRRVSLFRW
jgi:hypothetical protein